MKIQMENGRRQLVNLKIRGDRIEREKGKRSILLRKIFILCGRYCSHFKVTITWICIYFTNSLINFFYGQ